MDKPDQHDREAERIYNLAGVANRPAVLAELLRSAASYADRAIAAHVKDAHLEIREGARAGELVEVMAGKPVAGEWGPSGHDGEQRERRIGAACALHVFRSVAGWHWRAYRLAAQKIGAQVQQSPSPSPDRADAMAAADAWARANPRLLDWQMPPASEPAPSVSDRMAKSQPSRASELPHRADSTESRRWQDCQRDSSTTARASWRRLALSRT